MDYSGNFLAQWLDRAVNAMTRSKTTALTVVGFVLLAATGFIGYRWYDEQVQNNAHAALVELLKLSNAPLQKAGEAPNEHAFATQQAKWARVAHVAREHATEHARAGIAPFFHLMLGEAALQQGDKKGALDEIKRGLRTVKDKAFADVWQVKAACIALDSGDAILAKEGLVALTGLAHDKKSAAHQYALYQLGMHFWTHRDFVQAKHYWQQLLVEYAERAATVESEMFIDKVKSKLALITAEE